MTSTRSRRGERLVHLLNLDGFDKRLRLTDGGAALFPGREFLLAAREAVMLPLNVVAGPARVVRATGEILGSEPDSITFGRTQSNDEIVIASECPVSASDQYMVERRDNHWHVTVNPRSWNSADETAPVTVRFDRL